MRTLRMRPLCAARKAAAPRAEPSSPAAGCTKTSSNVPDRNSFPFAVQLRATPPATARRPSPVLFPKCLQKCCMRSEEHTSELQSRLHLVCRLLLEKKEINQDAARSL